MVAKVGTPGSTWHSSRITGGNERIPGRKLKADSYERSPPPNFCPLMPPTSQESRLLSPQHLPREVSGFLGEEHGEASGRSVRPAIAYFCTTMLFSLEAQQRALEVGR